MNSKTERKERALRCFADHLHCSQSILAAFSEECGISEETAFRLGSCFGSGMRRGMDIHLLQLLRYEVIRLENLDGFSEELQEKLTWIIGNE